jgi:hypothetical protein
LASSAWGLFRRELGRVSRDEQGSYSSLNAGKLIIVSYWEKVALAIGKPFSS